MKKLLILFLLGLPLASCDLDGDDFLAPQNTSAVTEEMVFTDSIRTTAFLTRIYNDIGVEFDYGVWSSHGNINQATDDAEYTLSASTQTAVIHYTGTMNPSTYGSDGNFIFWRMPYENIRRVNMLMANIDRAPLTQATKKRMVGEARYLRAWYYSYLVKRFGGVPIIDDQIYTAADIINEPRKTYAESVQYILDELDAAAAMLVEPQQQAEQFYGRANKGTCLALKSRVLLYAASPLFNGGAVTDDSQVEPLVSYPNYDASRWQRAADAAQDLINRGWYSLHVVDNPNQPGYGFYEVFLRRVNDEYIFARHRGPNRDVEGHFFPSTRGGAKYTQPTQNLVDAFPMANGLPITNPAAGYDPANPYANRDPRFGYSIVYNESELWWGSRSSMQPVYTFDDAGKVYPTSAPDQFGNGTTTGYYGRKMAEVTSSANTERGWPLIRYAEILLNYAEAINETGQPELAVPKLIEIRSRAGIQPGADGRYGIPSGVSVDELREIIHNERRIELAFEGGHRYWDLRRWKKMQEGQRQNEVMRITRNEDGTYTYNREFSIRTHSFRPALYLYPIPQLEMNKMPALVQNPGY